MGLRCLECCQAGCLHSTRTRQTTPISIHYDSGSCLRSIRRSLITPTPYAFGSIFDIAPICRNQITMSITLPSSGEYGKANLKFPPLMTKDATSFTITKANPNIEAQIHKLFTILLRSSHSSPLLSNFGGQSDTALADSFFKLFAILCLTLP